MPNRKPAPNPADTFLLEAEDLLAQIEDTALGLEAAGDAEESIHELFRAFHTIKGSGGMFGFQAVAEFTHHVETALDEARGGKLPVTQALLDLVLRAKDQIKRLLEDPEAKWSSGAGAAIASDLAALAAAAAGGAVPAVSTARAEAVGKACAWRIRFAPHPHLMQSGTEPLTLLRELSQLGDARIEANLEAIPRIEAIDPHRCYLAWEIELNSPPASDKTVDRAAIADVFIFVEDDARVEIEAIGGTQAVPAATQESAANVPSAESRARETAAAAAAARESVTRVPSERLDRLVNLVGELVMNQSRLKAVAGKLGNGELSTPVEEIERLVTELRESVLGIRMMPIGSTFSRFRRLVRDLSQELGKEIDLVTEGAETELDKTVLDQLGDPLVHMMRNAIDHGIGTMAERERVGKPRRGRVTLSAVHTGSNVVVTVADDGKGLDAARIRAKAIEKGLIPAERELSERETFDLIFAPGFSTAQSITSVSGRGVGMDVVKRQIDALRGSIEVRSRAGQGTSIALTLPLTLAIIDGLLVEIEHEPFIIPMPLVTENVELSAETRQRNNGRNVLAVRGELLPYIRVRNEFGIAGTPPPIEKVVIVQHLEQRVGLVVDRVIGIHQTVIQPLGRVYRAMDAVSGATIMGDGRVAIILNLPGLVRLAGAAKE